MFGLSIVNLIILAVIIAACLALMFVAFRKYGIQVPEWVIQCFWIVIVAIVVIFCIKLVWSMAFV